MASSKVERVVKLTQIVPSVRSGLRGFCASRVENRQIRRFAPLGSCSVFRLSQYLVSQTASGTGNAGGAGVLPVRSFVPRRRRSRRAAVDQAQGATRHLAVEGELAPAILRSPRPGTAGFSAQRLARCRSMELSRSAPMLCTHPATGAYGSRSNACTARNSRWSAGPRSPNIGHERQPQLELFCTLE
jgi:hypothetical protein